jgi:hypothetical protein
VSSQVSGRADAAAANPRLVTRAHINAAKFLIALDRQQGLETDWFVKTVAEARPNTELQLPRKSEPHR